MFTAVVWGADAPRPLALTLATLVPAAIDGALREVAVAGTEPESDARFVADQAGCRILPPSQPSSAISNCKGGWLLLVRSGDRVPEAWLDAALDHGRRSDRPVHMRVLRANSSQWRRWLGRGPSAVLMPSQCIAISRETDWFALTQAVRGRHLRLERDAAD